jgi:colicin import membrane protein
MTDRKADRVLSVSLSIFVHGLIVAALAWGWWKYRQATPTPQSLAIEGTVVNNLNPPPAPRPEPATAAPPTPDEQARKTHEEEQRKEAEEKAQEQKRAAEAQAQQQRAQEEKAAAEKAAAEKAAAAEEQRKQEAARQAKAEADRKAQELAQKQAEQRAQREADLKAQIAAEEHQNALQSSPARAEYLSLITARINRAWHRPPNARSGVRCTVHIMQIPGGEVTHVSVTGCNGDESVRQSVENAAYSASPLPVPRDPALFDANIDVTFAPDE